MALGLVARTIAGPPSSPARSATECAALCAEIIAAEARQVKPAASQGRRGSDPDAVS